MKFIILIAVVCVAHCSFAQTNTNAQDEIVKLENKWMTAMMQKDAIALGRIVAPEFKLEGGKDLDRQPVPRAVWMQNTMHNLNLDSVHFVQLKVDVIGNVAVARAYFFWQGAFSSEKFADSTFLVDTWMKRNQKWQVISRIVQ